MRRKMLIITFLVVLLISSLLSAGEDKWMLFATDKTSKDFTYEYYYDVESVTRPSKTWIRLWRMYKKKDRRGNLLRKGISFDEIDCAKRTVTKMENIVTFENGELSYKYLEPGGKLAIKTNTPNEKLYFKLCKNKKKKIVHTRKKRYEHGSGDQKDQSVD